MYLIPPNEIKERQKKFFENIEDYSITILHSPPIKIRSNDVEYRYRPSSSVLYLSGIEDPEFILVLEKKEGEGKVIGFQRKISEEEARWIGKETEEDKIKNVVDEVYPIEKFEDKIEEIMKGMKVMYLEIEPDDMFIKIIKKYSKIKRRGRYGELPPGALKDVRDILGPLRAKKSPREIEIIRKSVEITKLAIKEVEGKIRDGVFEFEIDAVLLHTYMKFGGWEAFPSIVASGKNGKILHYTKKNGIIKRGDIVIVDTGAEYSYYSADLTRPIPLEIDETKRDTILAVKEVQEKIISELKPGITFHEINIIAEREITKKLIDLGFLKGSVEENWEKKEFKKFYPHKIGHHLGLDTHDPCPYYTFGGPTKLEEGHIITIEPGIYTEDFGVRIEDDILITNSGCKII